MSSKKTVMQKPVGLFRFPGLFHFLVTLVITGIEVVGLVKWLQLERGGDPGSVFGPLYALLQIGGVVSRVGTTGFAAGVLAVFLLVEHVITQMDQTGRVVSGREFLEILSFSIIESVVWVVWIVLIPVNGIAAFIFFLVALLVEHQISDNVKKALPFFHFSSRRSRVFRGLIVFTVAEVVGAVLWVSLASPTSLLALAVGSLFEHYVARNVGQIRE